MGEIHKRYDIYGLSPLVDIPAPRRYIYTNIQTSVCRKERGARSAVTGKDSMRIVTLIENSPGAAGCRYEHGLSLYIETARHRILADTGASDGFLYNAKELGIDLSAVDMVFLSHGHYDHANGIPYLAQAAPSAQIYMQRSALREYFAEEEPEPRYIGVPRGMRELPRLTLLDGSAEIDDGISVMAGFPGRRRFSQSNLTLKVLQGDSLCQDSFDHEQALVLRQSAAKYCLFSGCAHNGILNILDRFRDTYGCDPAIVVSGFHFMKRGDYTPGELDDITATAEELARMDTVFFTGHCTSQPAYELMKPVMGGKLQPLHSGMEVRLPVMGRF